MTGNAALADVASARRNAEVLVAADLVVASFDGLPWPPPFGPD